MKSRLTRKLFVIGLTATALAVPGSANAGVLIASASDCADQAIDQTFLPWADVASYTLNPGGDFESTKGWSFGDGASVARVNEPFHVGSDDDDKSLSLQSGATATSAPICVGIEHPDIRFFARSDNSLATLRVHVLFEDAFGNVQSAPIGTVTAGDKWSPSAPLPIVVNLLPLLPGSRTAVAFKFTASGGSFQVDDLYVDPYRSV
jgi:hypothetical protein